MWSVGALAQGCGPQNPNCVVPDRPVGDSTNSAANTRFVQLSGGGGGGGGTSSTFGAPFPTLGTAIGLSDGTNMVPWFATSNYGVAPGTIKVPTVNAYITGSSVSSSGGTSLADGGTFTAGTTAMTPMGCGFFSSYTALTTAHAGVVSCVNTTTGLAAQVSVANATTPGRATSGNSSPVVQPSAPNSGATAFPIISAASTNATSVKTSAATVFSCQLGNTGAGVAFVKIYNKASAPTVGTDTPVKTLIVPGNAAGAGSNPTFGPGGFALGTGFALAITGLAPNSDTTAVAANQVVVNCDYE